MLEALFYQVTRLIYFPSPLLLLHAVYPEHPASQICLPGAVRKRLRETESRRHRSLGAVSVVLCCRVVVRICHRVSHKKLFFSIQNYLNYVLFVFFPVTLVEM